MLALLLGVVAVSQDWGGVRGMLQGGADALMSSAADDPIEAARTLAEEQPVANLAEDGAIRFRSAWSETQKLRVRCKEASAKGADEVALDRSAASRCRVTAYSADLNRISTSVDVATEGVWVCFANDEEQCVLQ